MPAQRFFVPRLQPGLYPLVYLRLSEPASLPEKMDCPHTETVTQKIWSAVAEVRYEPATPLYSGRAVYRNGTGLRVGIGAELRKAVSPLRSATALQTSNSQKNENRTVANNMTRTGKALVSH
jgi:hypothetical protein